MSDETVSIPSEAQIIASNGASEENSSEDVPENSSEDVPENTSEDVPKNTSEDAQENTSENVQGNNSENDGKNTSKKPPKKATKPKKPHGRQCPVRSCSTYNARKGFYHIPEHPGRRQDWLYACKLPSTTPYSTTICWKHFKLEDFKNEITEENIRQCKFGQLKKNVVPSLNLPMDDQNFHLPY